jgi:Tfp pilus assembly protein FimT
MRLGFARFSRAALTFAEILVVVATIALLAASAIPGLFRPRRRRQAAEIFPNLRPIRSFVGPIRGWNVK